MSELETNFNLSPYFDDFETNGKLKNYHKVLFKPGLAVQTRELNQLQSALQNQVARFGNNIYEDGTIVDGCSFQYEANVAFVKLQDNDSSGSSVVVTGFANAIIQGQTTGVRAKVFQAIAKEGVEPNTLLVKYLDGGTSKLNKTFGLNEELVYQTSDGGAGQKANTIASNSTSLGNAFGFGSMFSIGDGAIFSKGHFINVASQTIILEKYSNKPTYRVGLKVNETIVNSNTDTTLLDNAAGSYNYSAPGADRLKLTPTLTKKPLISASVANTQSFFPLFEVDRGNVKTIRDDTVFNSIGRELAKRTFEESGNYQLRQINTHVKEHLNTGSNYGRYTSGEGGNKNKLAIGIEPGIAYVMGYRNEILTTEFIDTDKGIDTKTETSVSIPTNFGNYVIVNEVAGPWDVTQLGEVTLFDQASTVVSSGTFSSGSSAGAQIGTAKIRGFEYHSGTGLDAQYLLYLFDINMDTTDKSFSDVKTFRLSSGGSQSFADAVLESGLCVLKEPAFNRNIYFSGVSATANTSNKQFVFRDTTQSSVAISGTGLVTISGVHAGGTEEFPYSVGSLNNPQKREFVISSSALTRTAGLGYSASLSSTTIAIASGDFLSKLSVGDYIQLKQTGADIYAGKNGASADVPVRITSVASQQIEVDNTLDVSSLSGSTYDIVKVFPVGHKFDMTVNGSSGNPRSITVNSSTQVTVNIEETLASSMGISVTFNNKRENAVGATKDVIKNCFIKLDLNTNSAGINGPWILGVSDVFNLRNVYVGSTYSTTNKNLVSDFRILRNTTDSVYKQSALSLKEGSTVTLTTSDKILVEFDYFDHNVTNGIGFFTVDSYPIDPNESTDNAGTIATPQIPRYSSTTANKTFDLRDTIDFRPTVQKSSGITNVTLSDISTTVENPVEQTALVVSSSGAYVPVPNETFQTDITHFLPRVDRVVLGKDGKKKVVKGISADRPFPPAEPAETMTLSLLNIPPFPSLSLENSYNFNDSQTGGSRSDLAVKVKPFFQRRFTMQDISGITSRIDRLEYYTALNVLEKAARDLNIPDGSGINRFKNGIFVDAFFGHDNGDLTDPSYSVSIDKERGELRPKFEQNNLDIQYDSSLSSNVTRKGKQARLDISGNTAIYRNGDIVYTGSSLSGATASGTIRSIHSDTSGVRLYLHDVTGTFTTTTLNNNNNAGLATINTIQEPTEGELLTLPYSHQIYVDQPWASKTINPVGELTFNWVGNLSLFPEADHWVDTTSQPDVQWDVDLATNWQKLDQAWGTQWNEWSTVAGSERETREILGTAFVNVGDDLNQAGSFAGGGHGAIDEVRIRTTEEQTRTGTRLNVSPFSRTQKTGPFVTRTDIVPYMRSRLIRFAATGMRPNTRVYPYFDNILVNDFVTPTDKNFSNTATIGSALETNANGSVFGMFTIPNTASLKFRQGERPFRLVDIANTSTEVGTESTSAVTNYTSIGLSSSQRGITFSTREAKITHDTIAEKKTVVTSDFTAIQAHKDPVAQSFRVGEFEFQNLDFADNKFGLGADGVFISAIDLYFKSKSSTAGISIELREVVNGIVTAVRVPFGFKRIESGDVNVSNDASSPTPFYFDQPVYLRGDTEYAFVVKPDGSNPDYLLWISELGGRDVTTNSLIDQQPSAGVMYVSSNDRNYTPKHNQDIQFTLWRADFDTNVNGTVVYTNEDDDYIQGTEFSSIKFNVGEKIRGESLVTLTGAPGETLTVNDLVSVGSNTGQIRKVINTTTFKADIKGTLPSGSTITFTRGSTTYSGVVDSHTPNTSSGFIQYSSPITGDVIANNSTGDLASDIFYRGQVSNATFRSTGISNFKYNVLVPKISFARYLDTSVSWTARTTASGSGSMSSTPISIEPFENNEFLDTEKEVITRSSSSSKTLRIDGNISTGTSRLSPVIDIGRSRSVILINNLINNDNSNEIVNFGNSSTKYISKKIVLADGQEAEDIKVLVSGYRPPSTEIDVYARFQNGQDLDDFRDKHYTKLNLVETQASNTVSSIVNKDDFIELEYEVPSSNNSLLGAFKNSANNSVLRYKNSSGANFDTFKYFSLKIVLRSSSSNIVPRVKDLRAIALQI